jgi:hypothetical protein
MWGAARRALNDHAPTRVQRANWPSQTAQRALRPSACSSWNTYCNCTTALGGRPGAPGGPGISCRPPACVLVVMAGRGRLSSAGSGSVPGSDRGSCRLAAARSVTVATAAKRTMASVMPGAVVFFMARLLSLEMPSTQSCRFHARSRRLSMLDAGASTSRCGAEASQRGPARIADRNSGLASGPLQRRLPPAGHTAALSAC